MTPGLHSDGIRAKVSGTEIALLARLNTIPGVAILALGGASGPGTASLRSSPESSTLLQWKAPGSSTWGVAVDCSTSGDYLLEDGEDSAAFARVRVAAAYLSGAGSEAPVRLRDVWNELGGDDVTAGEASAGGVALFEVELENVTGTGVYSLAAWLDSGAPAGLELSDSASGPWTSPTTEGAAVALGGVLAGASTTLHLRRTVSASAVSDPDVITHLRLSWRGT